MGSHCSELCSCFDALMQRAGTEVRLDARGVHCTILRVGSSLNFVPSAPHSTPPVSVLVVHQKLVSLASGLFQKHERGWGDQSFLQGLFDWRLSLILWDLACCVFYWESMLDVGFPRFPHFIVQGWYLYSYPYFIFPTFPY